MLRKPKNQRRKRNGAQFIIHANYLPTLPNLDETTSFTRFLEQGSTSRVYSGGSGTAIEVGGMYALASRFSFGFSFELVWSRNSSVTSIAWHDPNTG